MSHPSPNFDLIRSLHSKLYDNHPPTPLIPLPDLARQLGCAGVYVKDESERFGLPAFKVLGASWGLCSALAERVGVDVLDLEGVGREARGRDIRVYAATDGGSDGLKLRWLSTTVSSLDRLGRREKSRWG